MVLVFRQYVNDLLRSSVSTGAIAADAKVAFVEAKAAAAIDVFRKFRLFVVMGLFRMCGWFSGVGANACWQGIAGKTSESECCEAVEKNPEEKRQT